MGARSALGISVCHRMCVSILIHPVLHVCIWNLLNFLRQCIRKEEFSVPKLLVLAKNGPTWTRRKIQVNEPCTKLLLSNALTHTVVADYMLVYSRQLGQADEGQTTWIRISNPDKDMCQEWFPEEGGKEWFVDADSQKNKRVTSHPAGKFCVHVFFVNLVLPNM